MAEGGGKESLIQKTLWLEEIGGEWFVCCAKKIHGKRQVIRRAVREINEKIKEAM